MKNPKDIVARAAEAAEMARQFQATGFPEDEPGYQKLLGIIDDFVVKGHGYSGYIKTNLGFKFDVKLSLQRHVTSHVRITKA